MSFLYNEYDKTCNTNIKGNKLRQAGKMMSATAFIEWTKDYLANINPPMNVAYMPLGLGLHLRDGQVVSFSPQEDTAEIKDGSIPITRPKTLPSSHGVSDTSGIEIFSKR